MAQTKYQKEASKLDYIITKDYYGFKQVVVDKQKIAKYLMLQDKAGLSPRGGVYAKVVGKKVKSS